MCTSKAAAKKPVIQNHCINPNNDAPSSAKFPGGGSAHVDQHGNLNVQGGKGSDAIQVDQLKNGNYGVTMNGVYREIEGSRVQSLNVKGKKGNDSIKVGQNVKVPTTIDGGKGHDSIQNHARDAYIRSKKLTRKALVCRNGSPIFGDEPVTGLAARSNRDPAEV